MADRRGAVHAGNSQRTSNPNLNHFTAAAAAAAATSTPSGVPRRLSSCSHNNPTHHPARSLFDDRQRFVDEVNADCALHDMMQGCPYIPRPFTCDYVDRPSLSHDECSPVCSLYDVPPLHVYIDRRWERDSWSNYWTGSGLSAPTPRSHRSWLTGV